MASSGETSINWERPVGLVAQAERVKRARSMKSFDRRSERERRYDLDRSTGLDRRKVDKR